MNKDIYKLKKLAGLLKEEEEFNPFEENKLEDRVQELIQEKLDEILPDLAQDLKELSETEPFNVYAVSCSRGMCDGSTMDTGLSLQEVLNLVTSDIKEQIEGMVLDFVDEHGDDAVEEIMEDLRSYAEFIGGVYSEDNITSSESEGLKSVEVGMSEEGFTGICKVSDADAVEEIYGIYE